MSPWGDPREENPLLGNYPGQDEFLWVHGSSTNPDFVVHVLGRSGSGLADLGDRHATINLLTTLHQELRSVRVSGHHAKPMVDLDSVSVTRSPTPVGYHALGGSKDGSPFGRIDIDPLVREVLEVDRVHPG